MSMPTIVLAAGASNRMGSPKALLAIEGTTFLGRIAQTARAAGSTSVIAVVGPPDGDQVKAKLPPGVATSFNPDPSRGMLSSIQAGVQALPRGSVAALVWPVDQPEVSEATVRRILGAHPGKIVVPRHGGKGGHPVRVPAKLFAAIAALPPEAGLRALYELHPADLLMIEVDDAAVTRDIDTPQDLEGLRKRKS
jgi:molybdenum cofactor cytidylyltransferase